jgi:primosomal protein N' (replication factor Y)
MSDTAVSPAQIRTVATVAVDNSHHASAGFSYAVPSRLAGKVRRGQLVWVPLRKQTVLGIVLDPDEQTEFTELRSIVATVEPTFELTESQLAIATWLSRQTACSLFSAAAPFFPPGVNHRAVERIRLKKTDPEEWRGVSAPQKKLLAVLSERGELTIEAAQSATGSALTTVIPKLEEAGLIERDVSVVDSAPGRQTVRFIRLTSSEPQDLSKAPQQEALVDYLRWRARVATKDWDGFVSVKEVMNRTGATAAAISGLKRKGLIEEEARAPGRIPPAPEFRPVPELSPEQSSAWREIERSLNTPKPETILLHGVTGSGKTELYLRAVGWALRRGEGSIVLVPEIALASQVVRRFEARFPDQIAVLHSAMTPTERYRSWRSVQSGEKLIVVGPRSALFAPIANLGLIVIDEEQESAYKQEAEPRYHARTLAERIAEEHNAVLLLGSATPSVETFWRSNAGEVTRVELTERVDPTRRASGERGMLTLPVVEIIDLRHELHQGNASLLSDALRDLLNDTLARGEQAMVLLNRRGMATIVICSSCGATVQCPHCDSPLVYHQDRRIMLCHRCNYRTRPTSACGVCGGALDYLGAGTQRVETEVKRAFPEARVMRWDRDSVARQGGHVKMLKTVENGEIDIVVGTQMIAKGFDLPMVTAVGVIHADALLHLPDFRSVERTFQLVTQVSGRAGRRSSSGRVIVQSYSPRHYAIETASRHDYRGFYEAEIEFRRRHRYPPFSRLARYLFRHKSEEMCRIESDEMAMKLARHIFELDVKADLLGPAPAFTSKIRDEFQWQIVLRAKPDEFERLLDGLPAHPAWSIDIDPQSML